MSETNQMKQKSQNKLRTKKREELTHDTMIASFKDNIHDRFIIITIIIHRNAHKYLYLIENKNCQYKQPISRKGES